MRITIVGFDDLEEIHHSDKTLVLRGMRCSDGQRIVLKTTSDRRPSSALIASFVREQRLVDKAQGDHVVRLLGARTVEGAPMLVFEDFGGASLNRGLHDPSPAERLTLAIEIARAVEAVHSRGVVHKDINPSNLVWNRETSTLKVLDFGIATDLSREAPAREPGGLVEGTLRYISPEQTGRMNCSVDRRSDLYSLGATLYELFAGTPPFEGDDPLELVHAHLARAPVGLHERDDRIPTTVGKIVMRLLEKAPERRYQTAAGVLADLERCAIERDASGGVPVFDLGTHDRRGVVEVPQRLYGRGGDRRSLLAAFDRVASGGRELVLVTGPPGTGKTSLVREVYQAVASHGGDLLEGKFDQFRLGVPYAPLGHAFGRFLRQVLTLDDAGMRAWREKILRAVGANAAVLVEILPELAALLGPPEPVQDLAASEAENRFHLVFREFVEVIATPDHPIALFLDDLQWADVPSLRLFERLVTDTDSQCLLVIGAYRDREVDASHPLKITIDTLRRAGIEATMIALGALEASDVAVLVRDTFQQQGDEVDALTAVCMTKTGGNPFYLRRFLESLGERGLAEWHRPAQRWSWHIEAIAALEHTENVVSFMLDRLGKLPAATLVALQHAACIGDTFDLRLLAASTGRSPTTLQTDLRPAVVAELVAPEGSGWIFAADDDPRTTPDDAYRYHFVHDRVHQAAYRSMAEADAGEAHHRLGQILARSHGENDEGGWIFEVVNHLNRAVHLVATPDECALLATRNLEAGRRAMRGAAFGPALEYLETGIRLLPEDAWSTRYELALGLHVDAAECAYLNVNFDLLARRIDAVKRHARNLLDGTRALEIEMEAQMARGDLKGAVDVALKALDQLGFKLPENPGGAEVGAAVKRTMDVLAGIPTEHIASLPDVADPTVAAAQRILVRASSPAYFAVPALLPIIACELVVTSVQKGLSTATPFAFAIYGIVLNSIGMMVQAHAYGELAQRLIDRWDDRRLEARTRMVINNNVCTWIVALEDKLDDLREAYRIGRDTGDFEYAAISGQSYATNAFSAGRTLDRLLEEAEIFSGFMRNYGQAAILRMHEPLVQLVRAFTGGLDHPDRLDGPAYDEDAAVAFAESSGSASLVFVTLSDMLIARFHFGSAREAYAVAERARPHQAGATSTYHLVNFHTYAPLAASKLFDSAGESERAVLLGKVDESIALLTTWSEAGPMNHRHRLLIVQAERLRITQRIDEAATLYHQAIEAARNTHYLNDEALICELAARFYLARAGVFASIGRAFLEDASFSYQRWGASKKVERLREEFPLLLGSARSRHSGGSRTMAGTSSEIDIDAAAVVRAARSISAEIELDRLLQTLFRTIVEAGGAQKALLLLAHAGRWEIAVDGVASGEPALVRLPLDELDPTHYPLSVLRYVLRTGETVVVDDALAPGSLMRADAYTRSKSPRSVLCLPVQHRGVLASLLYLEHDRAIGVFTEERSDLMKLLMSQAMVSIHNAQLYEAQRRLTRAQSRFVPQQFLEILDRHDIAEVALGDAVAKSMSVCFSDLRGFTTIAETAEAATVIRLLNDYFAAMEPGIVEAGGFIDSFNGDGIMALFDTAPACAVRAGIAMHAALERFNALAGRTLRMGIGINTGPVVLGTVGGRDRFKCGVVGDAVNVASRIEGLTKRYGARLLIGESTHDALPASAFSLRAVDRVAVRGRTHAQTIFEVLDAAPPDERAAKERSRTALMHAMALYQGRDFKLAAKGFEVCRDLAPDDLVPTIFLERCRLALQSPLPDDWAAIDRLA